MPTSGSSSSPRTIEVLAAPLTDTAHWRRLAAIALALVAATTVVLVSMLATRDSSAPATLSAPGLVPAKGDTTAGELRSTVSGQTPAPARTRVYSPVDVRTLADARASGGEPRAAQSASDEGTSDEALPVDESPAIQRTPVPEANVSIAPARAAAVRIAPSTPAPTRSLAAPPSPPQPREHPRIDAATKRLPDPPSSTQATLSRVPMPTLEPARPRTVPIDSPRGERQDAASDLDAAWARREQWMRERLRQR